MTEEDDRLVRSLRDAIDPALAPGASERIAAGAWERAAELRVQPQPRFRLLRRTSWIAAAAASAAAVVVLAVRSPDAAFAVEGDPVKVQQGGAWVETSRVATDALVDVPEGIRVLRFSRGGTLRPQPGSLFRLVRADDASRPFRVEFQKGGGDVDGSSFEVRVQSVDVQPDPIALAQPLAFSFTVDVEGPRVCVDSGRALVRSLVSAEKLVVNATERAAMLRVTVASQPVSARLMKVASWTPATQASITAGQWSLVDAGFGAKDSVMLVGQDGAKVFTAFEVPSVTAPLVLADVQKRMTNSHMLKWVADVNRGEGFYENGYKLPEGFFSRRRVLLNARSNVETGPARYVHESGGKSTVVLVNEDGIVEVTTDGGPRAFANVAAFRAAMPETAALFGDELK